MEVNSRREANTILHIHLMILPSSATLSSRAISWWLDIVERKANDSRRIHQWTVDDHNAEHSGDVAWLDWPIAILSTRVERRYYWNRYMPTLQLLHPAWAIHHCVS